MSLQAVVLKPGISRKGTSYSETGRWYDGSLIRFVGPYVEKIGGWVRFTTEAFAGICREFKRFSILNGEVYTIIGTTTRCYLETGGVLDDISPLRATQAGLTNPFATIDVSATVTVTDATHGAIAGDIISISGADATGGISAANLNIETTIVSVTDGNTFTFTAGAAATSTVAAGGGTVAIAYILNPGSAGSSTGGGWGAGTWSRGTWGSAVSLLTYPGQGQIAQWSIEPYGEDMIIHPRYGSPYYWDATSPTTRPVIFSSLVGASSVPTIAIRTVVSIKDRHIVCFGVNAAGASTIDPMLIRWSDNESATEWAAGTTTTAGSKRLTRGSTIVTAMATRESILIWTDTSLYAMTWRGGEYVFSLDLLAENTKIAGFNAAGSYNDVMYWLDRGGFVRYAGNVQQMRCDIQDYILSDIDWAEDDKIYCGPTHLFNEISWFYVSTSSSNGSPDKYVTYNIKEDVWYYGTLSRTAWQDVSFGSYPLAASTDGYLYEHDNGFDDGSANPATAITAFVESSPLELGNGDNYVFITKILHDVTFRDVANHPSATQQMDITLKVSDYPGDAITDSEEKTPTRSATTPVEQYTKQSHVRLRGRQFKLRGGSDTLGSAWRLGRPRLEMRMDGRR